MLDYTETYHANGYVSWGASEPSPVAVNPPLKVGAKFNAMFSDGTFGTVVVVDKNEYGLTATSDSLGSQLKVYAYYARKRHSCNKKRIERMRRKYVR